MHPWRLYHYTYDGSKHCSFHHNSAGNVAATRLYYLSNLQFDPSLGRHMTHQRCAHQLPQSWIIHWPVLHLPAGKKLAAILVEKWACGYNAVHHLPVGELLVPLVHSYCNWQLRPPSCWGKVVHYCPVHHLAAENTVVFVQVSQLGGCYRSPRHPDHDVCAKKTKTSIFTAHLNNFVVRSEWGNYLTNTSTTVTFTVVKTSCLQTKKPVSLA